MDPSCADAHAALAAILFFSAWNWSGAKKSLERALEPNPGHTEARLLYGQVLEALGRVEEGLESKLRASATMQSAAVHLQISVCYWHQGFRRCR
jgi:hypothetical protein